MNQGKRLYTESDLERFLGNARFLAAAQAYSMDLISLGEAIVRAAEAKPHYPGTLEIVGYVQLFHEAAERISDGRILVPDEIRHAYSDVYDGKNPKDPQEIKLFSERDFMKFSDFRQPSVKKSMLGLLRQEYNEEDIGELLKNTKLLAAVDAYGRGLIDLKRVKESVFGDFNATPRDLSFLAFQCLCFEAVRQIQAGLIQVPRELENEFAELYHPPPPQAS